MNKVYQVITDRIIEKLKEGIVPWRKPWAGGFPKNIVSNKEYRGINIFLLNIQEFSSPYWLTFNQAKKLGGCVKKGEKSTPIVFWKMLEREDEDKKIPILRYYRGFNVQQCEGVEDPFEKIRHDNPPIERCENIITNMPKAPSIKHGESRAYYRPSTDTVNMPDRSLFGTAEEYYSTLFHELGHSTGHGSRLSRRSIKELTMYGTHEYTVEELIAEMSSCFLCNHSGIEQSTFDNSAAYIQGWLKRLRDDPKFVIQAGSAAQKATDFILNNIIQENN